MNSQKTYGITWNILSTMQTTRKPTHCITTKSKLFKISSHRIISYIIFVGNISITSLVESFQQFDTTRKLALKESKNFKSSIVLS